MARQAIFDTRVTKILYKFLPLFDKSNKEIYDELKKIKNFTDFEEALKSRLLDKEDLSDQVNYSKWLNS